MIASDGEDVASQLQCSLRTLATLLRPLVVFPDILLRDRGPDGTQALQEVIQLQWRLLELVALDVGPAVRNDI